MMRGMSIDNYIMVEDPHKKHFGGNQDWFIKQSKLLGEYGCGVLAIIDIELFFNNKSNISINEYKTYVLKRHKEVYKFKTFIGLFPWRMRKGIRQSLKGLDVSIKPHWHWKLGKKNYLAMILENIENDKPVLMAYNRTFMKNNAALKMYEMDKDGKLVYNSRCFSHYFVVTGVTYICGKGDFSNDLESTYFQVASCGEKLYIKYLDWMKGDFFSGIMIF